MEALPEGYRIDVCWGELGEGHLRLVAAFLQSDALKDPVQAAERAKHTAALAYAPDGTICAQLSAEPRQIKQLLNKFWTVAVYVHPDHRRQNLPSHMNLQCRDFFEARFKAGQDLDIIGWFMRMQSGIYRSNRTAAVTENSGAVFVGRNQAGHDLRVYYFEGARIDRHFDTIPPAPVSVDPPKKPRIEFVWENRSEELQASVATYLQEEGALKDPEQARERARHTVAVAYDSDDQMVAQTSAMPRRVGQLENQFWYVAAHVSPQQRHGRLASQLYIETRDYLEQRFKEGHDPDVIGIFVLVQTRVFTTNRDLAVSEFGMVFIGRNQRGDNMRVHYFEGADINLSHN